MKNTLIALLISIVAIGAFVLFANKNQNLQEIKQSESNNLFGEDAGDLLEGDEIMTIFIPELTWVDDEVSPLAIVYTEQEIPATENPLLATLVAFFEKHNNNYNGLSLGGLVIDGTTARINLTGSYIPQGSMTSLYVLREIEDMPFQFENINTMKYR
ncbi:MAG: hypothetical protein LRY44_00930 [Candidatus Pacebacteria bacterium]|nr:hypothetical protein [Candidatus Paceibacterota bacterium]